LEEPEKDRESLSARFAEVIPEAPDELSPEVRHQVYRMLRLEIRVMPNGDLDVCGVIGDHVYVQKATSSQTAIEELAPVGAAFVSNCSYGDTSPSLMARTAA
jgi:hypothetical protein